MIEFGSHPPTVEEMTEIGPAKMGNIWSQMRVVILRAVTAVTVDQLMHMPYEDFWDEYKRAFDTMDAAHTRYKRERETAKALEEIDTTWDRESPNARAHADMTALERMNDILDAVNSNYNGE